MNEKNQIKVPSDAVFSISVEYEDIPIKGNAIASGDPALDRQVEEELTRRLDSGDEWAWCSVVVCCCWDDFRGEDRLGCCSYKDEADFKTGGYYEDMMARAWEDVLRQIADRVVSGDKARSVYESLRKGGGAQHT